MNNKARNATERRDNTARYSWSLVTYAQPNEFERLLKSAKHWAWIYHDKDDKEPHYHIYVSFATKKSGNQLLSLIDGNSNTFYEGLKGTAQDLIIYFTHENQQNKYQYDNENIHYDNTGYWEKGEAKEAKEDANEEFLNDLICQKPRREMARKYGRDYMKNYRAYEEFARMIITTEIYQLEKDMEGIPSCCDINGEIITYHAELTKEELKIIEKLRYERNNIQ